MAVSTKKKPISDPKERSTRSKAARPPAIKQKKSSAADAVDEQLSRYREMRDFSITAEPSGNETGATSNTLPFCIQKHAASHLHYDFRLGWNGVLKSWAVAKGPSYFTGDKRLAVQVEDHPVEYGGFEGIIPKGQYGGGTVMLWDQGTWEPQAAYPDVEAGLRDGSLKFVLHGTKLKGKWALIRMKKRSPKETKPNWLLIKEHDQFEQGESDEPITEAEPNSVITGRTIEEIARNEDHVWNSKDTHSSGKPWQRKDSSRDEDSVVKFDLTKLLKGTPHEQQPGFIEPQLASLADVPPAATGWLHELKLDGYRIQARKSGKKVQLFTRTGLDWTSRFAAIAGEIGKIGADEITLDGELVVLAANGTTSFADLQAAMQNGTKHAVTYFAFDLLHLNGRNTRNLPLKKRKGILAAVLSATTNHHVRLSEHLETGGPQLLHEACKLRAEGIVSKRADSSYISGRSSDWVKTKCLHEQEFVVGGYTLPTNEIRGVGALLLGYFHDGKLIYAGRSGTGFTQKTHKMLRDQLEKMERKNCPFERIPADARKDALWVQPKMVVQIRFANWTTDELVRQAAFLGIREDKDASDVCREDASVAPSARRSRKGILNTEAQKEDGDVIEHAPVRLTHPDKVLDTASGMTKQQLADYYWAAAKWMLREIQDRPVSLVRCPDGIGNGNFFQKHMTSSLPAGVGSVDVTDKKTGKVEPYITVGTAEALASLAQIGVLELHPWGSCNQNLEQPDRIVFDLDPHESLHWEDIVAAAFEVKKRLQKLKLQSFVKTTGGKGLHIVAPIQPEHTWTELKTFAHSFVSSIEKDMPDRYLTKMTKAERTGKIYLDYLRNERGATSVSAYSPRARSGVPVSVPLHWSELESTTERPQFRVVDFPLWRSRLSDDPWKKIATIKQRLKIT